MLPDAYQTDGCGPLAMPSPQTLAVREDRLLRRVDAWLGEPFAANHIEERISKVSMKI